MILFRKLHGTFLALPPNRISWINVEFKKIQEK